MRVALSYNGSIMSSFTLALIGIQIGVIAAVSGLVAPIVSKVLEAAGAGMFLRCLFPLYFVTAAILPSRGYISYRWLSTLPELCSQSWRWAGSLRDKACATCCWVEDWFAFAEAIGSSRRRGHQAPLR